MAIGGDALQLLLQLQMGQQNAGRSNESGLISGPIRRRKREAREAELAQVTAQRESQLGQMAFQSSGLDPQQIQPGRLQGLQGLLSDPATRQAGLAELDQIQQAQGINQSQSARSIAREQLAQAQIKTNVDLLAQQRSMGLGMSPERLVQTADMLFDDRQRELAPYTDRLASFDQLMAVIDDASGPASVAVLFKFIKSMDDSVVRTSEGELLTSSVGPIGDLVNQFNKAAGGGIFAPETREAIKQTATDLAKQTFGTADRINTDHDKRAARFADQFQTPALRELSQGVGFDAGRTFEAGAATPTTADAVTEQALVPAGVTPN